MENGRYFISNVKLNEQQKMRIVSMFVQLNLQPPDVDNEIMLTEYFQSLSLGCNSKYDQQTLLKPAGLHQIQ